VSWSWCLTLPALAPTLGIRNDIPSKIRPPEGCCFTVGNRLAPDAAGALVRVMAAEAEAAAAAVAVAEAAAEVEVEEAVESEAAAKEEAPRAALAARRLPSSNIPTSACRL
jgi:hypothetical protein